MTSVRVLTFSLARIKCARLCISLINTESVSQTRSQSKNASAFYGIFLCKSVSSYKCEQGANRTPVFLINDSMSVPGLFRMASRRIFSASVFQLVFLLFPFFLFRNHFSASISSERQKNCSFRIFIIFEVGEDNLRAYSFSGTHWCRKLHIKVTGFMLRKKIDRSNARDDSLIIRAVWCTTRLFYS